ncbi:hypothetical protein HGRIS_001569 [Hohenbuehelia grisea]|uniref:CxC6 like cysteine cluster associated with KDZ domain-containing protein n=1 Tax=Hohenbuehelia grisea TaxID=104357 RepID=A0ABR3JPV6_9AGAR
MRDEDVMNGFFSYSLLLDKAEHGIVLVLPHVIKGQMDQLKEAMHEQNQTMEGSGQEAYQHACDVCCQIIEKDDGTLGKVQAVVCDGTVMGLPCCGVHDCQKPLAQVEDEFRTCSKTEHRELEESHFTRGKGLQQLRKRLERAGVVTATDSAPVPNGNNAAGHTDCDGKTDQVVSDSRRKLRARFKTNYTYCELLFMRPCRVILSRVILFGSEAILAVRLAATKTFPTPESTPEFLFYDSNCKLLAHQRKERNDHFKDTAQPVDVFHFCKNHKETDSFCQENCNPAAFPKLIKDSC